MALAEPAPFVGQEADWLPPLVHHRDARAGPHPAHGVGELRFHERVARHRSRSPSPSSSGFSTAGRIEYFTGPNSVDCMPVANSATSNTRMSCSRKPTAASDMIAISIAVVMRISRAFSMRSANWPAVAENRK